MNNQDVQNLIQLSIKSAVSKDWPETVKLNEQILEITPDDIPTLNRLGIAYSMIGESGKSLKTFKRVIELNPANQIAKNNIERLKSVKDTGLINPYIQNISFIEEPGKSKVIPLVSPGEPKVFTTLNIGEPVLITPSKHKIKVTNQDDVFIGYLPDNISHRLLELIKGGYKYKAFMKSVHQKSPQVFVQEVHSSKKLHGVPSFPLDENEILPNLSAGESSETPPLEIFDPTIREEA